MVRLGAECSSSSPYSVVASWRTDLLDSVLEGGITTLAFSNNVRKASGTLHTMYSVRVATALGLHSRHQAEAVYHPCLSCYAWRCFWLRSASLSRKDISAQSKYCFCASHLQ